MSDAATVFVVDDDLGVRGLLASELTSAGFAVEQFACAEDFLDRHNSDCCGCLLLDLCLAGMSGLELLRRLRSQRVGIPIIMITAFGDVATAVESIKLGAVDFLAKPFDFDELLGKVRAAVEADREDFGRRREVASVRRRLSALTARERELLHSLCAGKSSKMIAVELQISERTVDNHRANLLAKTGAHNVAELVRMSVTAGDV